jgi:hypothetical protein
MARLRACACSSLPRLPAKVFESGALHADGPIQGNDNDADARRFEPHYRETRSAGQVRIYESVLGDSAGQVATGLSAVNYLKHNRLLPLGFDRRPRRPISPCAAMRLPIPTSRPGHWSFERVFRNSTTRDRVGASARSGCRDRQPSSAGPLRAPAALLGRLRSVLHG